MKLQKIIWTRSTSWDGEEWSRVWSDEMGLHIKGHSATRWSALDQALDYAGMMELPTDDIPEERRDDREMCGWTVHLLYV